MIKQWGFTKQKFPNPLYFGAKFRPKTGILL
jgi:hypothetical protein